jgi:hypothetical protein
MRDLLTAEQRRQLASWLARQRKQVTGQCQVCGQSLAGIERKRYCSNACRMRAYRARQRQGHRDE